MINLDELNTEQRQAVETTEGYVRVIAGAGSGKTRALTYRYGYLVEELGISTKNILCVTFTNKAAAEMKKRIRRMIGDQDLGYICTFHGFCVQFLREENKFLHFPKNFVILDEEDQKTILKNVYLEHNIDSREYTYQNALKEIHTYKLNPNYIQKYMLDLDNSVLKEDLAKSDNTLQKIFLGYLYEQKKNYGLDFDDLIEFACYILGSNTDVALKWQKRLQYIMVDEYQDVNERQVDLVTILSNYYKNLFIVGDPDQTIYTWRGASVNYILNFDKQFPNAKTIMMTTNYRSIPSILDVANSLIEKNQERIKKDLLPYKQERKPVFYNHFKTDDEEANWICDQIELFNERLGVKYSEITILYRAHIVSRKLEEVFIRRGIPYKIYNGVEFYKRKEIKDMLSYLRLVLAQDDLSLERVINVPARNIGLKKIGILKEYAEKFNLSLYNSLLELKNDKVFSKSSVTEFIDLIEECRKTYPAMKVSELFAQLLSKSGYEKMLRTAGDEERLDNLAELKRSIYDFEESVGETYTLEEYLQKIALYTNSDETEKTDAVKMMTIHTAKGLEFPYVFLCKLNEGVFPSSKVRTKEQLEEERRLAYVAITRAENALFITDAEGINFDQSFRYPSRFIFDIKKELLDYVKPLSSEFLEQAERQIAFSTNRIYLQNDYKNMVNKSVKHPLFGDGKIIDIDMDGKCFITQFDNIEGTRNISFFYDKLTIDDKSDEKSQIISDISSHTETKTINRKLKKTVSPSFKQKKRKANKHSPKTHAPKTVITSIPKDTEKPSKLQSIFKLFRKK